jgi:predicted esterase YcpF (UPF0227 family)
MKILYIHGFGSHYDPSKSKIQTLQRLGVVIGVNLDYCEGFDATYGKVCEAVSGCDLIVGTSMGGYMASHVGAACGIPFVALNPAVNPRDSLIKHVGSFVDHGGNDKFLSEEVVANYPDIKTTNGCGLVLLEADDDVIDPKATKALLDPTYDVRLYEGGSHRFDSLPMVLDEIAAFVEGAEMVYGFGDGSGD